MFSVSPSVEAAPTRPDARGFRTIGALFFAQAILSAQMPIAITFYPLLGASLAHQSGLDASLATLPITATVVTTAVVARPMSWLMGVLGRRPGFFLGALSGAAAGLLAAFAAQEGDFWLLLLSAVLLGTYQSSQGFFRFAAADVSPPPFKATAMGWVLGGGLVAAIISPFVAEQTKDWLAPIPLGGVFIGIALINAVGSLTLFFVSTPKPQRAASDGGAPGRSLREIFAVRDARAALITGMITYALMTLMMTGASTAMTMCGLGDHAAPVVSAHVFAMFAPSFFVGPVVSRIGHRATIGLGLTLLAAAGVVAASGQALGLFYLALVLLGGGWSFGFIGASSWLASLHRPEERARVQGFNDMMVFGLVAFASLSSGVLLQVPRWMGWDETFGWVVVAAAMAPFLAAAGAVLLRPAPRAA